MKPLRASRLPYVDVLRAIAILTVVVHHLPERFGLPFGKLQEWGGRGVDLFFVLSGFLIGTTTLARAMHGSSRLQQAGAYWVLRTARIWPLYVVVLAAFAFGIPGVDQDVKFVINMWPWPYLTFTSNSFAQATLHLGIFWSLAIEEQFYLAVGFLVLIAGSRRDLLAATLAGFSLCAVVVSVRFRYELAGLRSAGNLDETMFVFRLFHSSLARMDQLAIGVLGAIAAQTFNSFRLAKIVWWPRFTTWVVIGASILVLMYFPQKSILTFFLVGLWFGGAVLWVQRPAARNLLPPTIESMVRSGLSWLGQLSFGLYVVHPIARDWVLRLFELMEWPSTRRYAALFFVLWLGLSTALAWLSYTFLESPILEKARALATRLTQTPKVVTGSDPAFNAISPTVDESAIRGA